MIFLNKINFVFILQLFVVASCSDVLKSNGTAGDEITPQMLIALGRKMNKPLLTLIGKVIENYHTCTDWSEWTTCGATTTNFFSTKTRTRNCSLDRSTDHDLPEEQTCVCEGKQSCPLDYKMTTSGFCFKYYHTSKTRDEAVRVCKNDKGFLLNIDSDPKYEDVKALLIANDEKKSLHIDGRRKNAASQWEYTYGSRSGYFHWYNGYPNAHSCLMMTGYRTVTTEQFLTFNNPCTPTSPFICEVQL